MASLPVDLAPQIGPDGIATDSPAIAYTEKVLEEKELQLKKFIEDNYSKIRNVERELSSLTLEIKLTAGPKKAALEHLRKKIELSGEKIKVAKQKEEQARKVWEAAAKALKEEEENKQKLCEDLNRLVQESAASQYARLEELKKRLEALNPELSGGAIQSSSLTNGGGSTTPQLNVQKASAEAGNEEKRRNPVENSPAADPSRTSKYSHDKADPKGTLKVATSSDEGVSPLSAGSGESRSRSNPVRTGNHTKGRNSLVKGFSSQKPKPNSWTGAGFDVDEAGVNA